ncbi:MAG TPA: tRNA (N(6)-L-threonylcarbamoyladenosine(37)-C(2))-methylthiotransferase MtaB [Thermomicrobiaceae bacterium]|nr:tRNA (N(6)-L-threonylcarbamoyladenosine(37)-C(2))-methylthiotransferase MtaB [Thermomicrobiaceae bacterium]
MDSPNSLGPPPPLTSRPPRFAICTLGCKLNQSDEEDLRHGLRTAGLQEVAFSDPADVYVVNTCTVTHLADRRSRQMLRRARRQSPAALVAAIGCYPAVNPAELEAMSEVDLVVGSLDKLMVVDDILGHFAWPNAAYDADDTFAQLGTRTRRMVKIQEGCRAHCTYCIIPQARGAPRNVPPEEVVRRVGAAVAQGYREVVLTGTHVGTYKWPDGDRVWRLADLLEHVLAGTTIERLRVTSVGPHEIDARFIDILTQPRMAPHLHMALQSGSDSVLRRMQRWYNTRQFRRAVRQLREAVPGIGLTTDVIVGFPGETDGEFAETCAFVEEMAFAKIHVFPFSPRRNTPAASMPDQVHPRVKERRSAELREISDRLQQAFVTQHVGAELSVLVEHRECVDPTGQTFCSGLTPNYLRVYVQSSEDLANRIVTVRGLAPHADGVLASAPVDVH